MTFPSSTGEREFSQADGGASFYFGLEDWQPVGEGGPDGAPGQIDEDDAEAYLTYGRKRPVRGQRECCIVTSPPWSRTIPMTLPGGAYGSLETGSFSLNDPSYSAKPIDRRCISTTSSTPKTTLEPASGAMVATRSAIPPGCSPAVDGGTTWSLVATNNSQLSVGESGDGSSGIARVSLAPVVGRIAQRERPGRRTLKSFKNSLTTPKRGVRHGSTYRATWARGDIRLRFDFLDRRGDPRRWCRRVDARRRRRRSNR